MTPETILPQLPKVPLGLCTPSAGWAGSKSESSKEMIIQRHQPFAAFQSDRTAWMLLTVELGMLRPIDESGRRPILTPAVPNLKVAGAQNAWLPVAKKISQKRHQP